MGDFVPLQDAVSTAEWNIDVLLGELIRSYKQHKVRLRGLPSESPEGDFVPYVEAVLTAESSMRYALGGE